MQLGQTVNPFDYFAIPQQTAGEMMDKQGKVLLAGVILGLFLGVGFLLRERIFEIWGKLKGEEKEQVVGLNGAKVAPSNIEGFLCVETNSGRTYLKKDEIRSIGIVQPALYGSYNDQQNNPNQASVVFQTSDPGAKPQVRTVWHFNTREDAESFLKEIMEE